MASAPKEFRPQVYLQAAQERMVRAELLDEERDFVLSHYVAGVAVECILRAYKARLDESLDERHDLRLLAKRGGLFNPAINERQQKAIAALGEVVKRWDNAHRYRTPQSLRKFLTDRGLFAKKGEVLEFSSAKIVSAMIELVTFGVQRWK